MPDVFVAKPSNSENNNENNSSPQPSTPYSQSTPLNMTVEKKNSPIPLFISFWQNPHNVFFDTQEANEHILLFLRRHFITNTGWIVSSLVLLIVPSFALFALSAFNIQITFLSPQLLQLTLGTYYLFVITYALLQFLDWYFNISLVTIKRIVDIEFKDLISKKVSATKISLVEDVSFQQTGAIRSIFNYGDVLVQTAATEDNFYMNAVPKPNVAVEVIENLIGKGDENNGA